MQNLTPKQVREAVAMIDSCESLEKDIRTLSYHPVNLRLHVNVTPDENQAVRVMLVKNRINKLRTLRDTLLHNYGVEYEISVKEIEEKA